MIHFFTGKTSFNVESVDPKGIGGGRKEHIVTNQEILSSLLV
jgi:hypothetical protein